jgi:hypothetical protein
VDAQILATYPAADLSIERLGDLLNSDRQNFVPRAVQVGPRKRLTSQYESI